MEFLDGIIHDTRFEYSLQCVHFAENGSLCKKKVIKTLSVPLQLDIDDCRLDAFFKSFVRPFHFFMAIVNSRIAA